jgi:hypothetical protein
MISRKMKRKRIRKILGMPYPFQRINQMVILINDMSH